MINGFRRSLIAIPRGVNKGFKNNMNIISRSLVDLSKKEQGEETIYIRKSEASKKKVLEEKMNEILQRHHEDVEKQALVNLLEKKDQKVNPREVSMIQYMGLDDWRWSFPLGLAVSGPLLTTGIITVDYKMYLVGAFAMMWHLYSVTLLPIWSEKTDWVNEYVRDAWVTFDKNAVEQLDADIKLNEEFLQTKSSFQDIFASVDDVAVAQAAAFNLQTKNDYHRAIQKKLDALAVLNETTTANIRNNMILTVKNGVIDTVLQEDVREDALDEAIEALFNGVKGRDVVAEIYLELIADYRDTLSDPNHPVHDIAKDLQSEIDDIVEPPQIAAHAGNVYETHPVV